MKILDSYEINFEETKIGVNIYQKEDEIYRKYEVNIFEIGEYTSYIVDKIKEDLLREGIFENTGNDTSYKVLRQAFTKKVKELIKFYFPNLDKEKFNELLSYLILKSLDLGFIDVLLTDSNLEEIVINGFQQNILVYHKKFGWLKTNLGYKHDNEIENIAARIALENRKNFSNLNPLLDAHLKEGHRVNATLSPISTRGSTITIRRFSDKPWTITDLVTVGTIDERCLAFIWEAIDNEFSVLVSGGTGSGKTSFLNAISSLIPPDQRILSVEDTREIRLPDYSHWIPLEARAANQEGKGEVTILDLIVNTLRMRPDRIIIGEIRRKKEAEVLFEAMRTGHSVYGTFHANTAEETVQRLSSPPIEIPKFTLSAIGLIVVQRRDRKTGKRITQQIAEMKENGEQSVVFQLAPKKGTFTMRNKPTTFLHKLNEFQGISESEFMQNIKEKMMVLKYLKENQINDVNKVGETISKYYKNKEILLNEIRGELSQGQIENDKNNS